MALLDEQVTALKTVLVGIVDKLSHRVLLIEITGKLQHLLEVFHLLPVVVGIREGKLQDESAHGSLLVI